MNFSKFTILNHIENIQVGETNLKWKFTNFNNLLMDSTSVLVHFSLWHTQTHIHLFLQPEKIFDTSVVKSVLPSSYFIKEYGIFRQIKQDLCDFGQVYLTSLVPVSSPVQIKAIIILPMW